MNIMRNKFFASLLKLQEQRVIFFRDLLDEAQEEVSRLTMKAAAKEDVVQFIAVIRTGDDGEYDPPELGVLVNGVPHLYYKGEAIVGNETWKGGGVMGKLNAPRSIPSRHHELGTTLRPVVARHIPRRASRGVRRRHEEPLCKGTPWSYCRTATPCRRRRRP